MFVVLLATVLAQAPAPDPEVAVIPVVRAQSIQPELAERLARSVQEILEENGYRTLPTEVAEQKLGSQNPAACQNTVACFALMGKTLGVPVLIRIEGTAVSTDLAVFIQAVRTSDSTVLAEHSTVTETSASREQLDSTLAPFLSKLRATSPPKPWAQTSSVATAQHSNGGATADSGATTTDATTTVGSPRPLWPLAPIAAGVVSVGTGAVLLAQAAGHHTDLTTKRADGAQLSPSQARSIAGTGNTEQTLGWVALGLGAAAAGAGAYLYFTTPDGTHVAVAPTAGGVVAQGSF